MRIVIAPDKFKGCLTAPQVAEAMAEGVRRAFPDAVVDLCPLSDGGEGFVDAMARATSARRVKRSVVGPRADSRVEAEIAIFTDSIANEKVGVVEMASASGLQLLTTELRDPELTTSFGTGQLLRLAVEEGAVRLILGIGGSATVDGGIGCCQGAGLVVLLDDGSAAVESEPLCGRDVPRVVRIKSHRGETLAGVPIVVACDVTNPLTGPAGAARVFGPQKGATPEQVEQFDRWLEALAVRCGKTVEANQPGAGAAGGMGFAMTAFFGATLRPGAELVMEATGLRRRLRGASLCLTGEGWFDASSLSGKLPVAVAGACATEGIACGIICAGVSPGAAVPKGARIESLMRDGVSAEASIRDAAALLEHRAYEVVTLTVDRGHV